MKKIATYLLFLIFGSALSAQTVEKFHRATVNISEKGIEALARLGVETDHGHLVRGRTFTTDLSDYEIQIIRLAGFEVKIDIEDVSRWYEAQLQQPMPSNSRGADCLEQNLFSQIKTPVNYKSGTMGGYPKYQEILATLDEMRVKFPNLITARAPISDTILTHEGRDIYFVKISDNPELEEAEPKMLYNALHHCREPNSASAMLFFMWHLLENYEKDPQIKYLLNNTQLFFIPCVNPDGYLFNEMTNPNGGGLFRKNRRNNGDGTFGVDLNRNYGYEWAHDDIGSSPNPPAQTYRGPAPFSEPETRMMRDFARAHLFKIIFNTHTYSNLLIYPWAYNDQIADPAFPILGKYFTEENKYVAGLGSQTVGYSVNGNSDDWFFADNGSFSFIPEIGPPQYGFWPPSFEIDRLNKEAFYMNLKPALCLLKFGEIRDKSAQYFTNTNFEMPYSLTRYGFLDGDLEVSLQPLTSNIVSVSAPKTYNLQQFENAEDKFSVVFSNDIAAQPTAKFLLILSNGEFSWSDTLTKTYVVATAGVFVDPADNLQNWFSTGGWGLTASDFVSPPFSFTDSPGGDYLPSVFTSMTAKEPIVIPADAQNPRLTFWAKWSIENNYDYVQVLASGAPLCGLHTNDGVNSQPNGEPIFDGNQNEWVLEVMDLSDFKGLDVYLEFRLVSDNFQNFDGFYFDDLKVEYNTSVGTNQIPIRHFSLLQNEPNPTYGRTWIGWENPNGYEGDANLFVFNSLGQVQQIVPIILNGAQKIGIETQEMPKGTYFYQIRSAVGNSEVLKMLVR